MNDEVWPAQTRWNMISLAPRFRKSRSPSPGTTGEKPRDLGPHFNRRHALPGGGSIFIGETGSLVLPHAGAPKLYPEEKFKGLAYERMENLNHFHGWLNGIVENRQPSDGFSYAGPLTEAVLLGTAAMRPPGAPELGCGKDETPPRRATARTS